MSGPNERLTPDPLLVSINEATAMLGISRHQVYRLLDSGALECRYIGRRRLVLMASLRNYVDRLPRQR
jgi:excisionase family DNA binding protein